MGRNFFIHIKPPFETIIKQFKYKGFRIKDFRFYGFQTSFHIFGIINGSEEPNSSNKLTLLTIPCPLFKNDCSEIMIPKYISSDKIFFLTKYKKNHL
jgi:hypothetical protein